MSLIIHSSTVCRRQPTQALLQFPLCGSFSPVWAASGQTWHVTWFMDCPSSGSPSISAMLHSSTVTSASASSSWKVPRSAIQTHRMYLLAFVLYRYVKLPQLWNTQQTKIQPAHVQFNLFISANIYHRIQCDMHIYTFTTVMLTY